MSRALALAAAGAVLLATTVRTARYFKPDEFQGFYDQLDPVLLDTLDRFRHLHGDQVVISPAEGAVGRYDDSDSQHNINRWGEVRAVDVFPLRNGRGLNQAEMQEAYLVARDAGFTGIGVYLDTKPYPMMHLDVRHDRQVGSPATWSRIAGTFGGIREAFA